MLYKKLNYKRALVARGKPSFKCLLKNGFREFVSNWKNKISSDLSKKALGGISIYSLSSLKVLSIWCKDDAWMNERGEVGLNLQNFNDIFPLEILEFGQREKTSFYFLHLEFYSYLNHFLNFISVWVNKRRKKARQVRRVRYFSSEQRNATLHHARPRRIPNQFQEQ